MIRRTAPGLRELGAHVARRLVWPALSIAAFVALWSFAATLADSRVLPGPAQVWRAFLAAVETGALIHHVGVTLGRVLASFAIAMLIGGAIGLALGRAPLVNRLFDPWLVLFLNLPALVVIILCYVWFGLTEVAAITAVAVNKIPNVAVTVREGARALDRDLLDMAHVYRFGWWRSLRHVVLPQLAPYILVASRSGLALVWKIVLVVELIGRSNGVGFELHAAFQLFDVATILAYALAFTAVVQAVELGILQPWEAALNRWR
jgi:NitT/TauT family transport system permease protein